MEVIYENADIIFKSGSKLTTLENVKICDDGKAYRLFFSRIDNSWGKPQIAHTNKRVWKKNVIEILPK